METSMDSGICAESVEFANVEVASVCSERRGVAEEEQQKPIAFTTYGGMGDEFLKKRWRPFYKELMAEELKAGGKGWKTRKRQQRALEKLSIVLARENGAMIARATSWQQAVATRP